MHRRFIVLTALTLGLAGLLAFGLMAQPTAQAQSDSDATFTVASSSLESNYPRGMTFTLEASSSAGEITRATLFYELRSGLRERANGEFDADSGTWTACPYCVRGGLPPWVDFHYTWSLTDSAGNTFETEPVYGIYADNTREWWMVDTDYITLYWFGAMPELGPAVAEAMDEVAPVFEEAWGRTLSYKPLAILFPDEDVWNEYVEGGVNPNAAGFTSPSEGYTVQRIQALQDAFGHESLRNRCGGYWYGVRDSTPEESRLQDAIHTIVHETTHLYQSDFLVRGPQWWMEGSANFFAAQVGWKSINAEGRMQNYGANGWPLDSLQGAGPSSGSSAAPDGCRALEYAVGESFIDYIVNTYGGYGAYEQILEAQGGQSVQDAIAEVLGKPFADVENEWRAQYGMGAAQVVPTPTLFAFPTAPVMSMPTPPGNAGGSSN